jgi:CRISPR-associated endonuclease/helicase Cas3
MTNSFKEFFRTATGGREPYPYQDRFAEADPLPHLLRAPTGAGKTAAAVLGWLWRWTSRKPDTPRRLVYCLPMRVLVEQTEREARDWIKNLGLAEPVKIHVLMGGADSDEWYLHPEKPAILIGTQDMLLSRALNRGYAASRFHWPIDFGLLNSDCLWVFDEPQLMGGGVSTSAQLAGLRKALGTFGPCRSVWMSATLEPSWLHTIDFRDKFLGAPLELDEKDYDPERELHRRMAANKTLANLGMSASKDMKDVARVVLERHVTGTQTLVVVNTVERAKAVYAELEKLRKKSATPKLLLVHSRFRSHERQQLNKQLQDKREAAADRIVVATQVVEAGVDISSRTLITELAPWASIVQRIGRCNRTGDDGPGQVFWIDLDEKLALPYLLADLDFARTQLKKLEGESVSPKAIDEFKTNQKITLPFEHKHVLRRRDLLDLFDTSPDLSGNDIDIQRFVRSDDTDTDVQVFWRDIPEDGPTSDEPSPHRGELCSVPIGHARAFLEALAEKKRGAGYVWDHLDGNWAKLNPKQMRPGLVILVSASAGGYDWTEESTTGKGWDPESKATVRSFPPEQKKKEEAAGSDPLSEGSRTLTIAFHTQNVCDQLCELLTGIGNLLDSWSSDLEKAARWHDVGKAHAAFQTGMRNANRTLDPNQLWAKSGTVARLRHGRKHFRHELASAIAALQQGLPFRVAYLIGAHHGKVRLAIRALPGEDEPDEERADQVRIELKREPLFALGAWDMDCLGPVDLGGERCPAIVIDLSPMQLGGKASWTGLALKLLGDIGPFKLAYLEAILRAADVRASQKEATG